MVDLHKRVTRKTTASRYEQSKLRRIILSLEPTAYVGVRLEGTRRKYLLDAEVLYSLAVKYGRLEGEQEGD